MKTAQVGRRLGISSGTIYNYTVEPLYADFFSGDAKREGGSQHSGFSEDDVAVIWTIYRLRRKMAAVDVAMQLREGYRSKDLPVDGAGAIDSAVENIRALGIIPERDAALVRVNELEEKIERLESERRQDAQEIGRLKNEVEFLRRALPAEIKKLLGLE
jgi:hypothetical protein